GPIAMPLKRDCHDTMLWLISLSLAEWGTAHLMAKKSIDFDVVREIVLAFPGVEEGTLHGTPTLRVAGRILTCPRSTNQRSQTRSWRVSASRNEGSCSPPIPRATTLQIITSSIRACSCAWVKLTAVR